MQRYSSFAIYLHWLIAIAILCLLISGWSIHYELWGSKQFIFQLFQWHKSIGVVVLFLVFFRVVWRIKKQPPPLPKKLQLQRAKIKRGHLLMYSLMIIMPLSGWILVSTNPQGIPTILFGVFDWLHLRLPKSFFDPAKAVHFYSAIIISAAVIGHVSIAIKHQFDGIELLKRMQSSKLIFLAILSSVAFLAWLSTFIFQDENINNDINNNNLKEIVISNSNENSHTRNITEKTVIDSFTEGNHITYSGKHAGNDFTGRFTHWQLYTDLNLEGQSMSQFNLSIKAGETDTGSKLYDKTLKEYDWFNVESFPEIYFKANEAEFLSSDEVKIKGEFTIKEITKPLEIVLSIKNNFLNTQFVMKRSEFNIGQDADPDAEWVTEEIEVQAQINILAR